MSLTIALEAGGPYDPHPNVQESRELWAAFREEHRFKREARPLWTLPTAQPKTMLNDRYTLSLNLSAGSNHLCVNTGNCEDICVTNESFRGADVDNRFSRLVKSQFLLQHPQHFGAILLAETESVLRKHPTAMARPNCNSDVAWESVFPWLCDVIPLYDYTKRLNRVGWLHKQYRTTYSATNSTREATVRRLIDRGDTVTCVFAVKKHQLPDQHLDTIVIDGDVSDDRFNDPAGVIVGLSAKGKVRNKPNHPIITPLFSPPV